MNLGIAPGTRHTQTSTFFSPLKNQLQTKGKKSDTLYKINTEHIQANDKSGKPEHTLFMNLKYKIVTTVSTRRNLVFSLRHMKSKGNC